MPLRSLGIPFSPATAIPLGALVVHGKLRVDPSPMVVALVLGPMMEKTLCQALFLTRGSQVLAFRRDQAKTGSVSAFTLAGT